MAALASAFAVPIADSSSLGWRLAFGVWAGLALVALGILLPLLAISSQSRTSQAPTVSAGKALSQMAPTLPWKSNVGWAVAIYSGLQALFYFAVLAWWPTIEQLSGVSQKSVGIHQGLWQIVAIASLLAGMLLHRLKEDARIAVITFAIPVMVGIIGQIFWPKLSVVWIIFIGLGIGGTFVESI